MYKKFAFFSFFLGITLTLSGCALFRSNDITVPAVPQVPVSPTPRVTTSLDTITPTSSVKISQTVPTCAAASEKVLLAFSLPFHNSKQSLEVTSDIPADFCDSFPTLTLMLHNPKAFFGTIEYVSYTGDSGGLFVPFAITKDDQSILLKAVMGSPGAGGGSIHYGYAEIPFKLNEQPNTPITDFPIIATSLAHFYDSFGTVIYIEEGENTPVTPKPGPGNNSVLMWRNLVTGEKRILSNEKDTSYEILELDEKKGIINFKAIQYQFSDTCLRESESALSCAKKTTTLRSFELPKK